jgi:hypothetical protein
MSSFRAKSRTSSLPAIMPPGWAANALKPEAALTSPDLLPA